MKLRRSPVSPVPGAFAWTKPAGDGTGLPLRLYRGEYANWAPDDDDDDDDATAEELAAAAEAADCCAMSTSGLWHDRR